MAYRTTRKMVRGYPFTLEWATEYAISEGYTQNSILSAYIAISHHASSSIGEAPRLVTIICEGKIYPFFAVASTDPKDCIFPCGTMEESIPKLQEIMGAEGPPTWYQKYDA
ncbi:hypothetical protein FIBSPDRAFT_861864 [Athelia psychrophila]|uniref:Uncharacterized protein n=1 Tax=Athelia psychrophila TaxID=1759441 RepID=A0A166IZG1_9AGAM|nr:hypothetical protein FIBSPDRAFT_861864 [Fibularhizoctonia sp. CBS 109695]